MRPHLKRESLGLAHSKFGFRCAEVVGFVGPPVGNELQLWKSVEGLVAQI